MALLGRMVEALNASGLAYCHWKGNYALDRVLAGEKDFELLVESEALNRTIALLLELGFKRAITGMEEEQSPGVSHYYGLDAETGRFVHVHLYARLLTGETFVKSHHLPFERMLLEETDSIDGVRVPVKSAELISHTLRTFVKYGSPVDLLQLRREAWENQAEFRWLQADCDLSASSRRLKEHCPSIDEHLFLECLRSANKSTSCLTKLLLSRRVRRRLDLYARHTRLRWIVAYAQLLWQHTWLSVRRARNRKILQSGGAVVAFVGPEATGKSTLVAVCQEWLGSVFRVKTIHAGKPPSSSLTVPANVAFHLSRRLTPRLRPARASSKMGGISDLIYALRAVVLAWDRRNLLVNARRDAANGVIVLCDRYPSDAIGAMDSPRLPTYSDSRGIVPTICSWLAQLERRLYDEIPAPDVALRLQVSVETAKARNRERIKADKEGDAYVEARHRQAQGWRRRGTRHVYDIDTEQSLDQTILAVKTAIWKAI